MYHDITLVGYLGRDPEMRYTPDGKPVTSFNVAVQRGYGEHKSTLWFRVSAWDKQAESCNQYLKKGSKVLVVGELMGDKATGGPRIWQGKDGEARTSFEVTAKQIRFLSSKAEQEQHAGGSVDGAGENEPQFGGDDDSIPF